MKTFIQFNQKLVNARFIKCISVSKIPGSEKLALAVNLHEHDTVTKIDNPIVIYEDLKEISDALCMTSVKDPAVDKLKELQYLNNINFQMKNKNVKEIMSRKKKYSINY